MLLNHVSLSGIDMLRYDGTAEGHRPVLAQITIPICGLLQLNGNLVADVMLWNLDINRNWINGTQVQLEVEDIG